MKNRPIFHEGELDAQRRAHEDVFAARTAKGIRPFIITGAIPFVRQQSMVFAGSEDADGTVWASILLGAPGFLNPSEDGKRLTIYLDQASPQPHDPFFVNVAGRGMVGLLLIEFSTRRRLRVNGFIERSGDTLIVEVAESYAICPKYIQKRDIRVFQDVSYTPQSHCRSGASLEGQQLEQVQRADTFFVASSHLTYGPDVSHRGGKPGFVTALPDGTFRIPDYRGNSMLSTFGNFTINPAAGLLFLDFERSKVLQLTGRATLQWDQSDSKRETGGTNRFWQFLTDRWIESDIPVSIHSRLLEYSPFNP
jgi:uncharacterized protein